MFFDGANPDFLLHSSHQCRICGSPQGEPHSVARSRNSRQEIKQSRPVPACRGRDLRFYGPFVEYFRQSPIERSGVSFRTEAHAFSIPRATCRTSLTQTPQLTHYLMALTTGS